MGWISRLTTDLPDGLRDEARQVAAAVRSRYPEPAESLWPLFNEYFGHVLSMSPYFNEKIGMRVGFEVAGQGNWAVDFRPGREGVFRNTGDCQYVLRFESCWLAPILQGTIPWEDFFLLAVSGLAAPGRLQRSPSRSSQPAWPEALDAVERLRDFGGHRGDHRGRSRWKAASDQHCPHAGQDLLETGELLPGGVIRCLGHHYEFDLTGQCLTDEQMRCEQS